MLGRVAATSRAMCARSTAPTMLRWRLLSVRFRSTRPAIWSGVAHPVGLHAVADIAARTSLAARAKAGSGRLSWLVNSPHRFASRLHATWEASSVTVSRSDHFGVDFGLFSSRFSDDCGSASDKRLNTSYPHQVGGVCIVPQACGGPGCPTPTTRTAAVMVEESGELRQERWQ